MAISDVSLTSGMRSNLLQLQGTAKLIDRTQERLSTGKQVNSALDNPTNFFAAQGHVSRASDLSVRKDGMSEAVQLLKAADAGIKAITNLIESAKGVAGAALATTSTTDRATYDATFKTLMNQITTLASDSEYRGTNLLTATGTGGVGSLTVEFGALTGVSTLGVTGFDATASGLKLSTQQLTGTTTAVSTANIQTASSALETALTTLRSESSKLSSNLSVVTTRQDYTSSMINALQIGSDNLTLADMNEEGANMLMLQTRQNLGITSLSLASQAAQAVLRLF
jgi:flagellin-like hook-associated protein FlgL